MTVRTKNSQIVYSIIVGVSVYVIHFYHDAAINRIGFGPAAFPATLATNFVEISPDELRHQSIRAVDGRIPVQPACGFLVQQTVV